jgi:hypothetical protein
MFIVLQVWNNAYKMQIWTIQHKMGNSIAFGEYNIEH